MRIFLHHLIEIILPFNCFVWEMNCPWTQSNKNIILLSVAIANNGNISWNSIDIGFEPPGISIVLIKEIIDGVDLYK